ncbi:MAG: hypothetical protein RBU45_15310 [Myxococcota bacterium]|jgi:hypothetical protein|nr:hypothetical protein [Myxococcota bacterium]
MPPSVTHDELLGALARRYDFHSAAAILAEALQLAGLPAAPRYTARQISQLVWGLNSLGERVQPAVMALLELASEAATADLPEEEEEPEEFVDEADLPLIFAQLVEASLATRFAQARAAQGDPPAEGQPLPPRAKSAGEDPAGEGGPPGEGGATRGGLPGAN